MQSGIYKLVMLRILHIQIHYMYMSIIFTNSLMS